jgi:hypothetical protein
MTQTINISKMIISVLNRKPVTDIETRNNFKSVIYNYTDDLLSLEPINIEGNNPAYRHKTYLDKLLILNDRYNSIGDDAIPSHKVEDFLITLQDNMRDYLNKNLQSDFYKLRKTHYTKLAFGSKDMELAPPTRLADLRERAFGNIKAKPNYGY